GAMRDFVDASKVPLIVANSIFMIGVLLIAWGFYNYWKGDPQGIILLVPGLFSLVMGWISDALIRKWFD
ncbi:MAG: hypothetical protein ACC707_07405, partial [Thiohalomonadales bacterium]